MRLNEALALRLNELLKEQNITSYRLSLRSGVTQATISDIRNLRNTSVNFRTIYELSEGFGMSLAEFFDCPMFRERNIVD